MYRLADKGARFFALLGGTVLTVLIVLVCASILGRILNSILHSDLVQSALPGVAGALLATGIGPVNGDFEIVEAGMAFAIFAFLPLCHLRVGHASVDVFTNTLSDRVNRILRMVIDIAFAAVMVLIAVQLFAGMASKFRSGQTTLLLQFPVWWSYAACMAGAAAAAVIAIFIALVRVQEYAQGRDLLPHETETGH